MIPLTVTLDIEKNPWTDLIGTEAAEGMARIHKIGRLKNGTESGKETVCLHIVTPDGKSHIAETTMALMVNAMAAFEGARQREAEEERQKGPLTTDRDDPRLHETKDNGQQKAYLVLTEEERAKGFVRPVRDTYRHVGEKPEFELRDLTDEEKERFKDCGYVKYEEYPKDHRGAICGRYWTEAGLKGGCNQTTTMARALAETYARQPGFYGSTFCTCCGKHLPVAEFQWLDGSVVGS